VTFDGLGPILDSDGFLDELAALNRTTREQMRAEMELQWAELQTFETRWRWSGPTKLDRQMMREYRLPWRGLHRVPRSVFSGEYRRRQRARVKRRQR
jgi:hypothetical protein